LRAESAHDDGLWSLDHPHGHLQLDSLGNFLVDGHFKPFGYFQRYSQSVGDLVVALPRAILTTDLDGEPLILEEAAHLFTFENAMLDCAAASGIGIKIDPADAKFVFVQVKPKLGLAVTPVSSVDR
jgi:hypothetical protein